MNINSQNVEVVKNYILNSIIPSRDAQELVKLLIEEVPETKK